jgi:D-sedoheptulose 7-phosphate isomerase
MSLTNTERISLLRKKSDEALELRRHVIEDQSSAISALAARMAAVIGAGKKILVCGNGGSAADSSHLVTELVVRLSAERNRTALPALSLTADSAVLTAVGNDYGYDRIFARQVEALGVKGDMLLVLSTSGNSTNVIQAVESATKQSLITGALLGGVGGALKGKIENAVIIPSESTQRIQEEHKFVIHLLVELVESDLFG